MIDHVVASVVRGETARTGHERVHLAKLYFFLTVLACNRQFYYRSPLAPDQLCCACVPSPLAWEEKDERLRNERYETKRSETERDTKSFSKQKLLKAREKQRRWKCPREMFSRYVATRESRLLPVGVVYRSLRRREENEKSRRGSTRSRTKESIYLHDFFFLFFF